jgi:hypothetical protein
MHNWDRRRVGISVIPRLLQDRAVEPKNMLAVVLDLCVGGVMDIEAVRTDVSVRDGVLMMVAGR